MILIKSQNDIPDITKELQNLCLHCLKMGVKLGVDENFRKEMYGKEITRDDPDAA